MTKAERISVKDARRCRRVAAVINEAAINDDARARSAHDDPSWMFRRR